MNAILDLVMPGIVVGSLYGMIGMAFAIIYKATRVVNFALGEMMLLTAYVACVLQGYLVMPFPLLVVTTIVVASVVGWLVERLVVRPMQSQPIFSIVMSTIGLALLLRSLVILIWGGLARPVDVGLSDNFIVIFGVGLTSQQIALVALLMVSSLLVFVFFRYSTFGLAMRSVASNETTAMLMGIQVKKVQAVAWVISSVAAGLAGLLCASIYGLAPEMYAVGLKGFPATILGGLDSILGSAFGGIIIGVAENLAGGIWGSGMKEVIGFGVIIIVLMIRPFGIFGQRDVERV